MAKRVKKAADVADKKTTETKSGGTSKIKADLNKKIDDIFTPLIDVKSKEGKDALKKVEEIKGEIGANDAKTNKWVEEQLDKATQENEVISQELERKKEEYTKLFDKYEQLRGATPDDTKGLQTKIRKMFNELDNNFKGQNQTNTKYTEVKIKHLLEQFLQNFEFLRKKK